MISIRALRLCYNNSARKSTTVGQEITSKNGTFVARKTHLSQKGERCACAKEAPGVEVLPALSVVNLS